ncbi:MAG: hypothetical protein ACD_46C00161G0005 [uncultured bacterium]|nr:MAG: hypothetical protein ACD_46C00161G0005 [uncultured bacterium]
MLDGETDIHYKVINNEQIIMIKGWEFNLSRILATTPDFEHLHFTIH